MNMNKIRVLIVSPQSLFQQGIQHSLSGVEDVKVSAIAEVNNQMLSIVDTSPPDVAIVDVDGTSENAMRLAHRIRQHSPNIAIVVLSSNPNDTQLFQALKA